MEEEIEEGGSILEESFIVEEEVYEEESYGEVSYEEGKLWLIDLLYKSSELK